MVELRGVDAIEALELVSRGAWLLDVRENDEWAAGRAPLAAHIPLSDLPDHLDDLPLDRVVVCVCRSGARSLRAARFLAENGFEAANLDGGMISWAEQGQALVSDGAAPVIS